MTETYTKQTVDTNGDLVFERGTGDVTVIVSFSPKEGQGFYGILNGNTRDEAIDLLVSFLSRDWPEDVRLNPNVIHSLGRALPHFKLDSPTFEFLAMSMTDANSGDPKVIAPV